MYKEYVSEQEKNICKLTSVRETFRIAAPVAFFLLYLCGANENRGQQSCVCRWLDCATRF